MLDVLHISNSAVVRGARAWHGGGRVLAGRIDGENNLGEIRLLKTSTGFEAGEPGHKSIKK